MGKPTPYPNYEDYRNMGHDPSIASLLYTNEANRVTKLKARRDKYASKKAESYGDGHDMTQHGEGKEHGSR